MCVIISVIKNENDEKVLEGLRGQLAEFGNSNPDGTGLLTIKEDGSVEIRRELEIPTNELLQAIKDNPFTSIHFRNATTGEVNNDNIHFWKIGNWAFCHNGSAYTKEEMKDLGLCDSFVFFRQLIKTKCLKNNGKIDIEKTKKLIDAISFWGRFLIINTEKKKAYFFGDYHANLFNDKTLVISSTAVDLSIKKTFYGLIFTKEDDGGIEKIDNDLEGIVELDLKKRVFNILSDRKIKNEWKNYSCDKKEVVRDYDDDKNWKRITEKQEKQLEEAVKKISEITEKEKSAGKTDEEIEKEIEEAYRKEWEEAEEKYYEGIYGAGFKNI